MSEKAIYTGSDIPRIPHSVKRLRSVRDSVVTFSREPNSLKRWRRDDSDRVYNNDGDLLYEWRSGLEAITDEVEEAKEFFRGVQVDHFILTSSTARKHAGVLIRKALEGDV